MAMKRTSAIGVWFFVQVCSGEYAQPYAGKHEDQHAERQPEVYSRYEREHAGGHEQQHAGKYAEDHAAYPEMYEGPYADQGHEYESRYAGKYERQYGGNYSEYERRYAGGQASAASPPHLQRGEGPQVLVASDPVHTSHSAAEGQIGKEHAVDLSPRDRTAKAARASGAATEHRQQQQQQQQQPVAYSRYERQHAGEYEQRYAGEHAEDYSAYREMYEGPYADRGHKYESRYAGKYERQYGGNYTKYERQASAASPPHLQRSEGPQVLAASDPVHAPRPAAEGQIGEEHGVDQTAKDQTAKDQVSERSPKDGSGKQRATEHHAEKERASEHHAKEPGAAALVAQREASDRAEAKIAELERWGAKLKSRVQNRSRALYKAHSIAARMHEAFRAKREQLQQTFDAKLQALNPAVHEVEDAVGEASGAAAALRRLSREEDKAMRMELWQLGRARMADVARVRSLRREAKEAARQAKASGLTAAHAQHKAGLEERVYERTAGRSEEASQRLEARAEEAAEHDENLLERQFGMVEGALEYLIDELKDANEDEHEARMLKLHEAVRHVMEARFAARQAAAVKSEAEVASVTGGGAQSRDAEGAATAFLARAPAQGPSSGLGVAFACATAMCALVIYACIYVILRGQRTIALAHPSLG